MSVKNRRFDKYLELFNNPPGDDRITLFFGELEDNAKEALKRKGGDYQEADIVLKDTNTGLHCGNFMDPSVSGCSSPTDIHPQWKKYIITFFMRLQIGTFQKDANKLALLKQLKNDNGSVDQFILVLLSKIAIFKIRGSTNNKNFVSDFKDLKNITGYIFKDQIDLFDLISQLAPNASNIFADLDAVFNQIKGQYGLTGTYPPRTGSSGITGAADVTASAKTLMPNTNPTIKSEWEKLFIDAIWSEKATTETANTMDRAVVDPNDATNIAYAYFKAIGPFVVKYDTDRNFGYNFDKYFKNKIFGAQDARIPVGPVSSFFSEPINVRDTQYWRKADSSLWTMEEDKEVRVDKNSQKYINLSYKDKCMGTNYQMGDTAGKGPLSSGRQPKSCSDYLRECLSGNNIEKCKDFLLEPEYWSTAEAEVNEMLPAIALKTLQSFEFKTHSTYDATNKMNIIKVINTTKWLEHLHSMTNGPSPKLSLADYTAIAANSNLMGYLGLLVKKINENPTLLNPSIKKSDEQKRYNKDAFKGTYLASMGMQPRVPSSNLSVSSVEKLGTAIGNSQAKVRAILGLNPLGLNHFPLLFSGGSAQVDELEKKLSSETEQTWPVFEKHYKVILDKFKTLGKDITKDDKDEIEKLIQNLRDSEIKLTKIYLMSEKYKDLLDIHGEKDNTEVLTIDKLRSFVDQRNKYFTRVSNKQNTLVGIITSLAEALQKENPVKTEPENDPKQEALNIASLSI
jgi:hypothetical protein